MKLMSLLNNEIRIIDGECEANLMYKILEYKSFIR